MANRKKISELDIAQSISGDDLFVVVDPNRDTGNDASSTGKTNKVTLNTIKNSMFPAGAPIQFWNQNSNNIFFNTGNVGIGTDSPVEPLHIESGSDCLIKCTQLIEASTNDSSNISFFSKENETETLMGRVGIFTNQNNEAEDEAFYMQVLEQVARIM